MVDEAQLQFTIRDTFGVPGFRDGQKAAIVATLQSRDSMVVLPTGAGKSLAFQLPPYARAQHHGVSCFTVVISPLIALMQDQVSKALEKGLDAVVFNSEVQDTARQRVLADIAAANPTARLLYTTPESLQLPALRQALQAAAEQGTLLCFAIDEAHAICDWGPGFRPAYLELASLKRDFPAVPVAAFTASCTPSVQKAIISLLGLRDPVVVKTSFNRPNIQYMVRYRDAMRASTGEGGSVADDADGADDVALRDLAALIRATPEQGGIIYARTRSDCDRLAPALAELSGAEVEVYHAGRDAAVRRRVQREWSEGGVAVVVATVAFGMGIDRADVRWVVHWNAPANLERFYQESGRAGRDGGRCLSVLYVDKDDFDTLSRLERGGSGGAQGVQDLAMRARCRRRRLLAHFGEERGPCDAGAGEVPCDVCVDVETVRRCLAAGGVDMDGAQQGGIAAAVKQAVGVGGPGGALQQRQLAKRGLWWAAASAATQEPAAAPPPNVMAPPQQPPPMRRPWADILQFLQPKAADVQVGTVAAISPPAPSPTPPPSRAPVVLRKRKSAAPRAEEAEVPAGHVPGPPLPAPPLWRTFRQAFKPPKRVG